MAQRTYESDTIRVHWDSALCIHTGICLNVLPEVFDLGRRPWIDVEAAEAEVIAQAVERCPTSALTYERLDDGPEEQAPTKTTVIPWPNGPLMIRGDVEVRDAKGNLFAARNRLTICRCGASQNQPHCDLSHRRVGFRSAPRVIEPNREQAESPQDITPQPGP